MRPVCKHCYEDTFSTVEISDGANSNLICYSNVGLAEAAGCLLVRRLQALEQQTLMVMALTGAND